VSQNIQKSSKTLLTPKRAADYIRLTNDGGDAAGDNEVRFRVQPKVGENQESRVSDTQPGPKRKKANGPMTACLRCPIFDN
jgi:hypothetical protein